MRSRLRLSALALLLLLVTAPAWAASASFTATGAAPATAELVAQRGDLIVWTTSGTFVGTVVLEQATDTQGGWRTIVTSTTITNGTFVVELAGTLTPARYRFRCTAFTSGTIDTVILVAPVVATSTTYIVAAGATPSVANVGANSCGTTAATIEGTDNTGTITVGATSGTQCRITFTVPAGVRRSCVVTDETTGNLMRSTLVDSTHTDILGTMVAADKLSYLCVAR
jgi:hypothetical protein